ncbi:MAG: amidohydrolase family protein [Actinomycetota bacterium]
MRTLYTNGSIYTPTVRDATSMLVDGADVAWVGALDRADAATFLGADRTIDLDGALITPAFVDAHVHATAAGLALTGLDLSAAGSLGEALELVDRHARASRGRPVLGSGWDETHWPEQRPPTSAELDRAGYGGLVYLSRVDAHSAVASSALLAAVPQARTLDGNRGDGWLTRNAHDAVRTAAYRSLTADQVGAAQRSTLRRAAALGIACLHEMAGPEVSSAEDLAALVALAAKEPGPQVISYWGELGGLATARELGAVGAGGDLFVDGSLGSHTAALRAPYADAPNTSGELRFSADQLAEHLGACVANGLQAGFHAIGDAAVDLVLDAVDRLARRDGPLAAAGTRVEHAEMTGDPTRFASAGLIASMQPVFDATWGGPQGMYATRVGPERARAMNRFAELAAAGVPLAFGSDAPVTPLHPWRAVQAAAYPSEPGAAISPRAAFTAHSRGGWRAALADGDGSGVLAAGAPATFAVWHAGPEAVDAPDERVSRWSTDPRAAIPGLPDLSPGATLPTCLQTVLRGETIFTIG